VRVDERLYTLKDKNPQKEVISGGQINEVLNMPLSEKMVRDLKNCKNIELQYNGIHKTVNKEGVKAIRSFLSGQKIPNQNKKVEPQAF
jgi:hypothetical protein